MEPSTLSTAIKSQLSTAKRVKAAEKCGYDNFGATVFVAGITNCKDSDKGNKPCIAGDVTYKDSAGDDATISDSCTGQFFVSEFACSGGKVLEYNIGCKKTCDNGACKL